ncbi:MAG: hypothetical protein ACRENE_24695, partial [Polyangiaceae bacterium]
MDTGAPGASSSPRGDSPLPGKTAQTLLVMVAALAVPYLSPRLRALRVVEAPWDRTVAVEDGPPAAPTPPPP